MTEKNTHCGFVSIIGAPNAGKSTLMNYLVGAKVSIVTHKVQTTRTRVSGIVTKDNTQMVFIDTPGIFTPRGKLDKAMVSNAWQGNANADIIMLLVDVSKGNVNKDAYNIIEELEKQKKEVVLVLNKIDLIKKDRLLAIAAKLNEKGTFSAIYMISALKGEGVDKLLGDLYKKMPESPWMYDADQISDMPMRLLSAEITREKIFLRLKQELPYSITVETESWEEFDNGSVKIGQVVYVMRDTQKGIVLGKRGVQIKQIGEESRLELEEIMGQRVHLKIFVKVRENWMNDPERYIEWGLDPNA